MFLCYPDEKHFKLISMQIRQSPFRNQFGLAGPGTHNVIKDSNTVYTIYCFTGIKHGTCLREKILLNYLAFKLTYTHVMKCPIISIRSICGVSIIKMQFF